MNFLGELLCKVYQIMQPYLCAHKYGCVALQIRVRDFINAAAFSFSFVRTKENETKEKAPAARFGLLWHVFSLNKKNSHFQCSNSFLFLTLQNAPPLHAKNMRPEVLLSQKRFAL